MKVKSARDDAMVRLVVGGNPVFVTNVPVEIDESDEEAMNQVNSMISLGWLVRVEEEVKEDVQEEKVQEEVVEEAQGKQTARRRGSK
jgi:urease accessory protein UreH